MIISLPALWTTLILQGTELAQLALDLSNWVYEGVKDDDDPKVEEFQEIQDQHIKGLGCWEWLVKLWAVPGVACLDLWQAQMYKSHTTHL